MAKDNELKRINDIASALDRLAGLAYEASTNLKNMNTTLGSSDAKMRSFGDSLDRVIGRGGARSSGSTRDIFGRWGGRSTPLLEMLDSVTRYRKDLYKLEGLRTKKDGTIDLRHYQSLRNADGTYDRRSKVGRLINYEQEMRVVERQIKSSTLGKLVNKLEGLKGGSMDKLMNSKALQSLQVILEEFPNTIKASVAVVRKVMDLANDFYRFYSQGMKANAEYVLDIQRSQNLNLKQYGEIEASTVQSALQLNREFGRMIVGAGAVMEKSAKLLSEGWSVDTLADLGETALLFEKTIGSGVFDRLNDTFKTLYRNFGEASAETIGDKLNTFQGMFGVTVDKLVSALDRTTTGLTALAQRRGTSIDKLQGNLLVATAAMESFASGAGDIVGSLQQLATTDFAGFVSQTAVLGGLLARSGTFNVADYQRMLRVGDSASANRMLAESMQNLGDVLNEYEFGIYTKELAKALGTTEDVVRNMMASNRDVVNTFDEATQRMIDSQESMRQEMSRLTTKIDEQVKVYSQSNAFVLEANRIAREQGVSDFTQIGSILGSMFGSGQRVGDAGVRAYVMSQNEEISDGLKGMAQVSVMFAEARSGAEMGFESFGTDGAIIGGIIGGIVGLIETVINSPESLGALGRAVGSIVSTITTVFEGIWKVFEVINPILQGLLAVVFDVVSMGWDLSTQILEPLVSSIGDVLAPVKVIVEGVMDLIAKWFRPFLDVIRSFVRMVLSPFSTSLELFTRKFADVIPYLQVLMDSLGVFVSSIVVVFKFVSFIYDTIASFIGAVGKFLGHLGKLEITEALDVWKDFGKGIASGWGDVEAAVGVKDASGRYDDRSLMGSVSKLQHSWGFAFGGTSPVEHIVGPVGRDVDIPDVFIPANPNLEYAYTLGASGSDRIVDAINAQTDMMIKLAEGDSTSGYDPEVLKRELGQENYDYLTGSYLYTRR